MQYDIVRAWKDEESQVAHPAGEVELSESELALVSGRGDEGFGGGFGGGYGKGGDKRFDQKRISNRHIYNTSFATEADNDLIRLLTLPIVDNECNFRNNLDLRDN